MLPEVPKDCNNADEWKRQVEKTGQWYIRFSEGGDRLYGRYPDILVAFYSNARACVFGLAVWDRGRVTVQKFPNHFQRRQAAEEYLVSAYTAGPRLSS